MTFYRRVCKGVADHGKLVPTGQEYEHIKNYDDDYYFSIFDYDDNHFAKFRFSGSVAKITDVTTTRLVWDFDDKANPDAARQDALELVNRLLDWHLTEENIWIGFSGQKGIGVEIDLDTRISVEQFKQLTAYFAKDLTTRDGVVSNPSRIIRVFDTKHPVSGLYKIPLTYEQLQQPIEAIRELAAHPEGVSPDARRKTVYSLSKELTDEVAKAVVKPSLPVANIDIDFSKKVKGWSNCKWALTQGYEVREGDRNYKLLCIAATARALNNTKEQAYYLAKNAMKMGVKRNGGEECSKEDISNVVNSAYAASWEGGTFTCKDGKTDWLTDICKSLGHNKCKHNDDQECFVEIDDFAGKFKDFATNIKDNTLKLGVPLVDDKVMITTSMMVGLVGAPSSGKTSLLLNFLEQSNKDKIESVFFSMDMGLPLVYLRLIQKHCGLNKDQVFDMFIKDKKKADAVVKEIKESYAKTKFSFKTGMSVEGMRSAILDHQDRTGKKVKLVGVDYLECISSQYSDATASSAYISNQLKDIANDLDVCVMLLLQTQKHNGDPSEPLLSMRNIKGSSVTEQACSVILTMSRPGFSPETPENDRFVTISSVKDRMGAVMSVDCGWDGLQGQIYDLAPEQREDLATIRNRKAKEKAEKQDGWN